MPDLLTIADTIAAASEIPFILGWIAFVAWLIAGFLCMRDRECTELHEDLERHSPGDWANHPRRDDA